VQLNENKVHPPQNQLTDHH